MVLEACFLISSEFGFRFALFSFKPEEQPFKMSVSLNFSNTFGIAQPGTPQPLIPEIP